MVTQPVEPDRRLTLASEGGVAVATYVWEAGVAHPKGAVQVVHGMSEHAPRYGQVARALNTAGYLVYAHDQRGHGQTDTGSRGFFGEPVGERNGWDLLVHDVWLVNRLMNSERPECPRIVFGHSMGALVAQSFLALHGSTLAAAILSAPGEGNRAEVLLGLVLSRVERLRVGPRTRSGPLQLATFGDFNRRFSPNRTRFDWLSRDPDQVDAYIEDPLCGEPITSQAWLELFGGMAAVVSDRARAKMPTDLPMLVLVGGSDPVCNRGKTARSLVRAYRRAGVADVQLRAYEGARHELVNETNGHEIIADVVEWLNGHVKSA